MATNGKTQLARSAHEYPTIPIYRRERIGEVQLDPGADERVEVHVLRQVADYLALSENLPPIGRAVDAEFDFEYGDARVQIRLGLAARD